MEPLLTVRDLSAKLRLSACTVYRLAEKGTIPFLRPQGRGLRFRADEINAWLERSSQKPIPALSPEALRDFRRLTSPPPDDKDWRQGGSSEMARTAKSKTRLNFGFGAIYQRVTKEGIVRWYLDYRDTRGKRIQRIASQASSRDEAVLALKDAVLIEHHRKLGIRDAPKKLTFREFSKLYLDNYARLNKRSWRDDQYRLDAHMIPFFGASDLQEITPLDVEKYKASRLSSGVSKSTVNRELTILKKMFNLAIDWDLAVQNPVIKVKLFSEKDTAKERILTAEEETRLLAECPGYLRPIINAALHTGMRRGEILNLRWAEVDLDKRLILVKRTKSGQDRLIPINESLLEVLADLKHSNSSGELVFPNPATGKPYTEVKKSFKEACKRAGITDLRFHDLRHTFATRLVAAGVDIVTVRDLLGHFSIRVTQRYTHPGQSQKVAAVELLAPKRALGGENLLHPCYTN